LRRLQWLLLLYAAGPAAAAAAAADRTRKRGKLHSQPLQTINLHPIIFTGQARQVKQAFYQVRLPIAASAAAAAGEASPIAMLIVAGCSANLLL
jgi:hypothetical protein